MYKIEIDDDPNDEDMQTVRDGIVGFNSSIIGEKAKQFVLFLKNDHGNVYGGVLAWLHSESVYVDVLWVDESLRALGYGTKLLRAAENEAKKKGCSYSTLDTYSFQAEEFYLKNGYKRLGEIPHYLFEHSKIFLRKNL